MGLVPLSNVKEIDLIEKLFPICRSITGNGVRQSLQILQEIIPLEIVEIPTGTEVFDWKIPKEWNITDAYIKDQSGNKVVDFQANNLHVLSYSTPVGQTISLDGLRPHLFSCPDQPDVIPYRTSYYNENWGFCLAHEQLESLEDGQYEVLIDSSLEDGSLSYGEYLVEGKCEREVLLSTHICHPSLCNDNLSGLAAMTFLADSLRQRETRYAYRFLFIPVTIGAIAWLAQNEDKLTNIRCGLVASNLADHGRFTYKKTRSGNNEIDRVAEYVLRTSGLDYEIRDFVPYGYDERQYNSPGLNLKVGSLSRTPHGEYPEYHTSRDNLSFISSENLLQSIEIYKKIIATLESSRYFENLLPKGEPQLGRRGLYKKIGGETDQKKSQMATLWVLNQSDGSHSLLEISEMSGLGIKLITETAELLVSKGLLEELSDGVS